MRVRVLEALPRETSPPHSANGFAVPLLKPSSRERPRRLRRLNFVHSCYARNLKRDHTKKKLLKSKFQNLIEHEPWAVRIGRS